MPELDLGLVGVLETSGQRGLATFGGLFLGGKLEGGLLLRARLGCGQLGHGGDVDYRSFPPGGRPGQTVDVTTKPYAGAFVELWSGDADPTDTTKSSFTTLYSTAHKFHGEMDFFLNLPRDTAPRRVCLIRGTLGFHPLPEHRPGRHLPPPGCRRRAGW
ncbi:MAG: hypothetical protein R3B72_21490 [Polyangiaceae bacterium]